MPKRKSVGKENVVGQNIVRIRKQKKIRQTMLLSRLQVRGVDISQPMLSAIEGQKRKVTDVELLGIADALEVSLESLFHPEDE